MIIILLYFHMRHPIFFSLLLLLLGTASSVLVNGCIKYTLDINKQLKCIYCFYNMGLTQSGTCEVCKSGYTVIQGTCQLKPTPASSGQATGFTGFQMKSTMVLPSVVPVPSTISNINIQSAESNYFFTLNNNKKSTNSIQDSPSPAFISFGQLPAPQPSSAQLIQQSLPNCEIVGSDGNCQKCKDKFIIDANKQCQQVKPVLEGGRANCFMYSSMTNKCLQCKSSYTLTQQGLCIQAKAQKKETVSTQISNSAQSNAEFDISQSFQPLSKYTSTQGSNNANNQGVAQISDSPGYDSSIGSFGDQNQNNDFGYFGTGNTQTESNNIKNNINNFNNDLTNNTKNVNATAQVQSAAVKVEQNAKTPQKPVIHKYPQFPYCFDYFGDSCWACVPGYLLNLIIKECVPYVKPVTNITKPIDKTSTDQADLSPSSNCNVFSQSKGICEECYRNYYFNKEKKSCLAVDQLCRTYDEDTGICKSCYTNYSLSAEGKCLKKQ